MTTAQPTRPARPACADDPELFFSATIADRIQAKHICKTHCRLRSRCLAQVGPTRDGILAGILYGADGRPAPTREQPVDSPHHCRQCSPKSTAARTLAARRANGGKLAPTLRPSCGTAGGYERHREHGENPCDPCREANKARRQAVRDGTARVPRCGTIKAARRHAAKGEPLCAECQAARDAHDADVAAGRNGFADAAEFRAAIATIRELAGCGVADVKIGERLAIPLHKVRRLRRLHGIAPGRESDGSELVAA